ncbi:MAG: biopolymer transporter ExbD [Myxococcota bacterium]
MGMAIGGGGSKGRGGGVTPDVNVTPLVDVCLVVLIIFMVVTPLMMKAFRLTVPPPPDEAAKQQDQKSPPVFMMVEPDGTILINRERIGREALAARLPRMLAAQNVPVLLFNAKDGTPYGVAVEVMDLARASGATNIAIVTRDAP